jgi:hypothetical protein
MWGRKRKGATWLQTFQGNQAKEKQRIVNCDCKIRCGTNVDLPPPVLLWTTKREQMHTQQYGQHGVLIFTCQTTAALVIIGGSLALTKQNKMHMKTQNAH